jgi:hypothetical protein
MTSREEAMRLASQTEGAKVRETDREFVVSSVTDTRESYALVLKHTGYMTLGKDALVGVELEEGPIFGYWPGLGLIGEFLDENGKEVESSVMNNPGLTVLVESPESMLGLVSSALSICLTEEQTDVVMDTIHALIVQNQAEHTPSKLVEQTHQALAEEEKGESFITPVADWEEDDPTGLLKVARAAGMPMNERRAMYDVMHDPALSTRDQMAKAKVFLAQHGINLVDLSDGASKEVRAIIQTLHAIGAVELVAENIRDGVSAIGISISEIAEKLPPEKAAEFRRVLGNKLEGKED